jgi:hypothetical protein
MTIRPTPVTDRRSNLADQIRNAAIILGRSLARHKVFSAIYEGRKQVKTISEIVRVTKLPRIRVTQEAAKLAGNDIVSKTKIKGELAYQKDSFIVQYKNKILSLAKNPERLTQYPTKSTPHIAYKTVRISVPKNLVDVRRVTVDDIESFSRVRQIQSEEKRVETYESDVKNLFRNILSEKGKFQDWGGETGDLYSTRIRLLGKRRAVMFGLKGRGTTGILTPKKMGKNGDQIQRLFRSPADVFLVQYNGQIDTTVIEQMEAFASAKSALEAKTVFHGVIDGQDTERLFLAYSKGGKSRSANDIEKS